MHRREFLGMSGLAAARWSAPRSGSFQPGEPSRGTKTARPPILAAHLGKPIRYPESHGDLWTATWSDDDNLYVASDDTQGFDRACSSNLAVSRISGRTPPDLKGVTVNPMKDYGGWGEVKKEDSAMWKACGLTSIDGVLYLAVSRHFSPPNTFCIQETWDTSVVKSTDHGRTWSAAPKLGQAMFPGRPFSTLFFVEYGKDGQGGNHGTDHYVYTVSNDGAWNNGNFMTMGRVRRSRIGRLDPRDWEFIQWFEPTWPQSWTCAPETYRDLRPVWGPRYDQARHIFYAPGRTSMTGIHYIAPLGVYIMPQWHYTHLHDPSRQWKATRFEFYQADAPWGPWTLFHTQDFEPEGWYNPCIPSKFISEDGRTFWVFVAGDWTTATTTHGLYGLHMIPVTLEVQP